jgi:hypothetical protein
MVLFVGIHLYMGIVAQKVPGYPNSGQLGMYVIFPGALMVVNACLVAYALKIPVAPLIAAFAFQLFALPIFIVLAGGGI